ncbi:MAG: peptide chain release factor N(5)-glutamine methyltransferase [Pseudomonadota bacterium]|nr:peptide chain release factor N(5)-glutamine methyltransferase [Pseudomonadota bacterium]
METVAACLQWGELTLAQAAPELLASCKVDSQWLLAHVLQRNSAWLRAWPEQAVSDEQRRRYQRLVERRAAGEPVAYLTGQQGFWSLDLCVTEDTLVPRPDTELLVEQALLLFGAEPRSVVDLGTGSGAIALALAHERPAWSVTATDIHAPTLAVARRNSQQLAIPLQLVESAWFENLPGQCFHLIVSNPPYIEAEDEHLQGVGVRYEPLRALASGVDGLDDIRQIVARAPDHLYAGGWLLLEHGYNQGDAVRTLLLERGFDKVSTVQDLGDNDRVTLGQWRADA